MKDQSINSARKYISDQLSSGYPKEEISSLIKIILLESTRLSATDILIDPGRLIDESSWHKINKICADLKKYRPIQYILGKTEFYGMQLIVNEHTLIPRQETEELVDLIICKHKDSGLKLIEIGTGSGAIAIALAKHLKKAKITASDISHEALNIAKENAKINECEIEFIRDDIFDSSLSGLETIDLIVSNPPYVRDSEKVLMHRNVLDNEPAQALFVPDSDPLIYYRQISKIASKLLKKGGSVYFEINEALGPETLYLLVKEGFTNAKLVSDIHKKDRILTANK